MNEFGGLEYVLPRLLKLKKLRLEMSKFEFLQSKKEAKRYF